MTLTLANTFPAATMTPSTASLDAVRQRKEARAKDALQVLQALKTRQSSANEDKKAAARKKVEDLKARIQSLRMTMVGNPEAMAKMAAQLARELGAAAKAYAAAGGSPAGMSATPTPAPTPTADASAGAASGAEASGAGVGDAQVATAEGMAADDTANASGEDASGKEASARIDPYRQVIDRQQAQASEQARQNADKEADDKFVTDVKRLASELKAILRQAAEAAKRKGDPAESPDQKSAEKALAEVDAALEDIASPMAGLGFSLEI